MKQYFKLLMAAITFSAFGFIMQSKETAQNKNVFRLYNLNTFSSIDSDSEDTPSPTPPDPWNYVPGHYLTSKVRSYKLVCSNEGSINISGITISGDFSRGVTYTAIVETKNCDGKQDGAWCDQRMVGSTILSVGISEDSEHN